MHACVIGAGVVGCATAYELACSGHQVTLLDAAPGPGLGTSFANGAQLSYRYVEPLASPATLRSLPAMLCRRDSPLRLRPRLDVHQWRWGLAFLRACTSAQSARGTRHLLQLGECSRITLDRWLEREPLAFGLQRNGKLVLCFDAASFRRQAAQAALQAQAGALQSVLTRDECLQREPALAAAAAAGLVGGIWTPGECLGDPHRFCQALVAALRQRGARIHFATQVHGFVLRHGVAAAVETSQGPVQADVFVVAAGLASRALAAQLGESLPLYPIKGYSITLKMVDAQRAPAASVTDLSRKMVFAPLGGQLRVAAMAEIVGDDLSIPSGRVDRMLDAVQRLFPGACALDDPRPWAGLRPATPDSLPIIRRSRIGNVILNAGHGALGFTLAAGSARLVGRLVEPARLQSPGPPL